MTTEKQWTLSSFHEKGYGRNKTPAAPERCAENVYDHYLGLHQCSRKRGHGPEEAYCKIHSPEYEEAKRQKRIERNAEIRKSQNRQRNEWAGVPILKAALEKIAEGEVLTYQEQQEIAVAALVEWADKYDA